MKTPIFLFLMLLLFSVSIYGEEIHLDGFDYNTNFDISGWKEINNPNIDAFRVNISQDLHSGDNLKLIMELVIGAGDISGHNFRLVMYANTSSGGLSQPDITDIVAQNVSIDGSMMTGEGYKTFYIPINKTIDAGYYWISPQDDDVVWSSAYKPYRIFYTTPITDSPLLYSTLGTLGTWNAVSGGDAYVRFNLSVILSEADINPPIISALINNATSDTREGTDIKYNASITDSSQLSYYISSTNKSGVWVNNTQINISGTSYNLEDVFGVNEEYGTNICYKYYFSDILDNIAESNISCFTVSYPLIEFLIPPTPIDNLTTNQQQIIDFTCTAGEKTLYLDNLTNPITEVSLLPIVSKDNLTYLYHFDNQTGYGENETIAKDFSIYDNNANIINSIYTDGRFNKGMYLNGDNGNYIDIDNDASLNPTDALTLSIWYKIDSPINGFDSLINTGLGVTNGYWFTTYSTGVIYLKLSNGVTSMGTTVTIPLDWNNSQWYHIAATWNGTKSQIYRDGVPINMAVDTAIGTIGGITDMYIGKAVASTHMLNGTIDEAMVFNRVLTPAEILILSDNSLSENYQSNLPDGTYYYKASCDGFNTSIRKLIIDLQGVEYLDVLPLNDSISNEDLNINISVSEYATCYINNTAFNLDYSNDTYFSFSETTLSDGQYDFIITCYDILSTPEYYYLTLIKDRLEPFMNWNYPKDNNKSIWYINQSKPVNIELFDKHLWAYQMLVYNPDMNLIYNFTEYNLPTANYSISDIIMPNMTGNWTIELTASDSHTSTKIDDYKIKKSEDPREILFQFEKFKDYKKLDYNVSIVYAGGYGVLNSTTTKKFDRYNFKYKFDKKDLPKKDDVEEIMHRFEVRCENIQVIEDSEYSPHFICPETDNWIDFQNPTITRTEIYTCGEDCYSVLLWMPPEEEIEFNSIGGLNINSETVQFMVIMPPVAPFDLLHINECPIDNTQSVLMFAFLLMILIIMYVACKTIIKIPIVTVITGLGFIVYCFTLIGCNAFIGVIGIMVSIGLISESVLS